MIEGEFWSGPSWQSVLLCLLAGLVRCWYQKNSFLGSLSLVRGRTVLRGQQWDWTIGLLYRATQLDGSWLRGKSGDGAGPRTWASHPWSRMWAS